VWALEQVFSTTVAVGPNVTVVTMWSSMVVEPSPLESLVHDWMWRVFFAPPMMMVDWPGKTSHFFFFLDCAAARAVGAGAGAGFGFGSVGGVTRVPFLPAALLNVLGLLKARHAVDDLVERLEDLLDLVRDKGALPTTGTEPP
jgi:hypothetical protein